MVKKSSFLRHNERIVWFECINIATSKPSTKVPKRLFHNPMVLNMQQTMDRLQKKKKKKLGSSWCDLWCWFVILICAYFCFYSHSKRHQLRLQLRKGSSRTNRIKHPTWNISVQSAAICSSAVLSFQVPTKSRWEHYQIQTQVSGRFFHPTCLA